MKRVIQFVYVTCSLALLVLPAQAQEWSAEQLEVWEVVSTVWDKEMAGDDSWMDLLDDSFQSWPGSELMPHDKADVARFVAAEAGRFKIVLQDISPVAIIISGDTAVAHYYHTTISEYDDGEREASDGRSTDILRRTGNGWRFVSWVHSEWGEDE